MDEKIDLAIAILVARITTSVKFDEALKFTQAALNLANVKATLSAVAAEQRSRNRKPS